MMDRYSKDDTSGYRWWSLEGHEASQGMIAAIQDLELQQKSRIDMYMRYARLYGELTSWSTPDTWNVGMGYGLGGFSDDGRLRNNIVRPLIDTLASRIAKNKPRPMFLTEGGSYSLRQNSQKMTNPFRRRSVRQQDLYPRESSSTGCGALRECISGHILRSRAEALCPTENPSSRDVF